MIIDKIVALRRLLVVWLIGGFILFGLSIAQTIGGAYGHDALSVLKAWGAFLPWMTPVAVILIALTRLGSDDATSKFMSNFCMFGSIAYLLLLLMTWAGWPLTPYPYAEWMHVSYIWVLPSQVALNFMIIRMARA